MTMKQQTVRGMPQWGKFKDAVSALRSQVNWLLAANNEESAFFVGMIAEGIEKSPKFFVPNVSGVFRKGDLIPTYDGEKHIHYKQQRAYRVLQGIFFDARPRTQR